MSPGRVVPHPVLNAEAQVSWSEGAMTERELALSRFPALPVLADRLVPDATVVLDDIDRDGELRILEAWERDSGFRFEVRPDERIAVGRRSSQES